MIHMIHLIVTDIPVLEDKQPIASCSPEVYYILLYNIEYITLHYRLPSLVVSLEVYKYIIL